MDSKDFNRKIRSIDKIVHSDKILSRMVPINMYPGEVIGFKVSKNGNENILYWYSEMKKPHFFKNASKIFYRCKHLRDISGLKDFDFSKTENLNEMFVGCDLDKTQIKEIFEFLPEYENAKTVAV